MAMTFMLANRQHAASAKTLCRSYFLLEIPAKSSSPFPDDTLKYATCSKTNQFRFFHVGFRIQIQAGAL
jgi:hypothetical protein